MLLLFTDFGSQGPYLGDLRMAVERAAPGTPVVDLLHDAPPCNPRASAYLLAALAARAKPGDVLLAVVDPGVGSARRPLVLEADGRWFVGPDNGLFDGVIGQAAACRCWQILWQPPDLSPTFHGRDLFAPVAAGLPGLLERAAERFAALTVARPELPPDLAEVVYIDRFGNAMTGLRAAGLPGTRALAVAGRRIAHARTFADVPEGHPFWYANSYGLVEIAVNRGSAARQLGLAIGTGLAVC